MELIIIFSPRDYCIIPGNNFSLKKKHNKKKKKSWTAIAHQHRGTSGVLVAYLGAEDMFQIASQEHHYFVYEKVNHPT